MLCFRGDNMPRRKKLPSVPDYTDGGKNSDKLLVQKTNPLLTLSETAMTLSEFKILDAYLSRIDSRNPDKRYVRFEKGELEQLLGVTRMHREELEKRIDNLFQVVTIRDENKPKNFTKIALFTKAECEQDESGQWQVNLACSPEAMEYIFNIDNIGYLRYRLRNVIDLTSRYSYILYLYLEHNRFRKSWEVNLDELKTMLRCTADTYNVFWRFNDLVLRKCHKELTEKTTLRYTYEPIKRGRTVKAIRFTLETVANQLAGQLSLADITEPRPIDEDENASAYSTELLGFLASACDFEFNNPEMRVLMDLILQLYPYSHDGSIERFNYLRQKYNILTLYASKQKITSRFGYLKALIEVDIKEQTR